MEGGGEGIFPRKTEPGAARWANWPRLPSYPGQLLMDTDMIPGSTEL